MCHNFSYKYKNKTQHKLGVLEVTRNPSRHAVFRSARQRSWVVPPSRLSDGGEGGRRQQLEGPLRVLFLAIRQASWTRCSTLASPAVSSGSRLAIWRARPAPPAPLESSRTRPHQRSSVCIGWCLRWLRQMTVGPLLMVQQKYMRLTN